VRGAFGTSRIPKMMANQSLNAGWGGRIRTSA
jgi:hypothetical protein